ncbi:MAG: glycosyltransferase family 2 protein [Candidatus Saccharimonadales bacterium]
MAYEKKALTLSIVIPVYNEEDYIGRCLDAIAAQSVKPDEVIVIDNNSTDKSEEIVRSFSFVKLLRENQQHQVFAQKTGFDHAKSDILGRIDADTVLPPDWVKKVKAAFTEDSQTVAVTGGANPYDIRFKRTGKVIFNFYINLAGLLAGRRMIWGANCAIRRTAWHKIRNKILLRPDIFEDYDLSFCLAPLGDTRYLKDIEVASSFRAVHPTFLEQTRYQFRAIRTFWLRTNPITASLYGLLWSTMFLVYPLTVIDGLVKKFTGRPD